MGQLQKRVDGGETFDVLVLSPRGIEDYIKGGKIAAGSNARLAKVGVGVMVKEGAPKPDVSSVEAFKQALLKAKSVGYIDPASGGSSGIYVAGLLDKLGIADQVKPKAKLKQGGHVSDLVKSGEAEIGIHQISEIVSEQGVTLVGPLPAEIQNYTVYAVGLQHGRQGRRSRQGLHQGADRAVGRGRAQVQGNGRGLTGPGYRTLKSESARLHGGRCQSGNLERLSARSFPRPRGGYRRG